jgi:hypothetical protein
VPQPLPPRAHAALLAVACRLDAAGVRWLLAGSAGRALLGHRVRPADIDLEVAQADAAAAAAALGVSMKPASGRGRTSLRGGVRWAGVEVDVTAGLTVEGPAMRLAPDEAAQLSARTIARLSGRAIPVAPVEEAVARAIVLGEWDALAKLVPPGGSGGDPAPLRADYVARRLSSATARATR